MASFLLRRPKVLLQRRGLLDPSPFSDVVSSFERAGGMSSLASCPLDRGSVSPRPDLPAATTRNLVPEHEHFVQFPFCVLKLISANGKLFSDHTFCSLHGNPQFLACWLHVETHGGELKTQAENFSRHKHTEDSKVLAFSPLEGTLTRERKSRLVNESLKVKRIELSIKTTYALLPLLLLVSKTKLTTSMLVLCTYWQIYGFFKEIILDYVHHEVTRKWVLIYFKLLLLVLAKDTVIAFNLL
ncbi:hypothetical protein ZIOFF_025007 [Zingiber officinale]|uniref:Succinate dehydrogenase subunit 4 n=1 Tax=Zingiber officinale TaxID=94328 RepID=A0A8J5LJI8_ZINOF|nr:hypothetical protein ZIOFF_025007 [Zingiber officinale]